MKKFLVILTAIVLAGCTGEARGQSRDYFPDCSEKAFGEAGGVVCSGLADGTVVTAWNPGKSPQSGGYQQCVCNNEKKAFVRACDPGSDGESGLIACFGKNRGSLPEGPVNVEFFRDPIYCTTIGGDRLCWCIDNPFTPTVNECAN